MGKRTVHILFVILFSLPNGLFSQECPNLITPLDGATDVPVFSEIRWTKVDGIIGYLVSLGTTPGGGEIINRRSSGLNNFYTPNVGLPENTVIYVTISLFLPDQPIKVCPLKIFTTRDEVDPPSCTTLSEPLSGQEGIRVDARLKWDYAPGATDYIINVGTEPGASDIVENYSTGNILYYIFPFDLPLDQEIYVRITPYNENGEAESCAEESFKTGVPTASCGANDFPFLDFPDTLTICRNQESTNYSSQNIAIGYRWYKVNPDESEVLISERRDVNIMETGSYRVELFNVISEFGATIECPVSKYFNVVASELPSIEKVTIARDGNGITITISADGSGNYEYSLEGYSDNFQDSPVFSKVSPKAYTIYVRDKYGCGTVKRDIDLGISKDNFPKFFTPNGDGTNDFWQFIPNPDTNEINIDTIRIFDRYGALVTQLNPKASGWDGKINGRPAPSNVYWYKATTFTQAEITGYFALKR